MLTALNPNPWSVSLPFPLVVDNVETSFNLLFSLLLPLLIFHFDWVSRRRCTMCSARYDTSTRRNTPKCQNAATVCQHGRISTALQDNTPSYPTRNDVCNINVVRSISLLKEMDPNEKHEYIKCVTQRQTTHWHIVASLQLLTGIDLVIFFFKEKSGSLSI